jgi:hypothetical protein
LGENLVGSVGLNDPSAELTHAGRVAELETFRRLIDRILSEIDFARLGMSHTDNPCGDQCREFKPSH